MNRTLARNRQLEDVLENAVGERLPFKRVVDQGTLVNLWSSICDLSQELQEALRRNESKVSIRRLLRKINALKNRAYKLAYPPFPPSPTPPPPATPTDPRPPTGPGSPVRANPPPRRPRAA